METTQLNPEQAAKVVHDAIEAMVTTLGDHGICLTMACGYAVRFPEAKGGVATNGRAIVMVPSTENADLAGHAYGELLTAMNKVASNFEVKPTKEQPCEDLH